MNTGMRGLGGNEGGNVAREGKRRLVSSKSRNEGREVNLLDNDLLELGVNLRGHLTLGDVSEKFLLGGLEVLLEAV